MVNAFVCLDSRQHSIRMPRAGLANGRSTVKSATLCSSDPKSGESVTLNPLCGDWEGLPDAPPGPTTVRIHVLQSSDGTLTAWMDVLSVVQDQNYGLSLNVIAADLMSVILQNESPSFSFYNQFNGKLSNDRNSIAGRWNGRPARWTFRRIR
jgi:hypothetical protein